MEVKIGVRDVAREVVLESELSLDDVASAVADAMKDNGILQLTDDKGRTVLIPAAQIGYIEIGAVESRRIGFGAG